MRVPSLGQEDPLEKEMATHSSILAWRIPWTEEPGGLQSRGGRKEWIITEHTHTQLHKHRDCGWMTVLFIKPKAYLCFIPNTWQELGTDFEEFSKGLSNFPKGQTDNYLHRVSAVEKLILVCVCVCVCVCVTTTTPPDFLKMNKRENNPTEPLLLTESLSPHCGLWVPPWEERSARGQGVSGFFGD